MKKLLLTICIVAGSAITLNAENLIQNSDFEGLETLHKDGNYSNSNANAPLVSGVFNYTPGDTQWRLKKSNTGYIRSDFQAGADVYEGTQSLKLAVNSGYATNIAWYNNVVYQSVIVDPSKAYEVKLWAKGNAQLYAQFYTYVTSALSIAIGGQPSKVLQEADGWAQYTYSLDIPSRDNSSVPVQNFTDKTIFSVAIATTGTETATTAKYAWVDNIEIKIASSTGIENNDEAYIVPIYVNNKTVYFNIEETQKVSVYSVLGSLVKVQNIAPGQSLSIETNGCYVIKIESSNGKISTQKVIIK